MKKLAIIILVSLAALSTAPYNNGEPSSITQIELFYENLDPAGYSLPDFQVFSRGFAGYQALKMRGLITNHKITIVDYSLSSNKKRLWVIDMDRKKVLVNSLVAHGKKSGGEFARSFSNKLHSHQSSLGFYITGETYYGKHGLSLYLEGVENGINDNAHDRAIVMHGADYVSRDFIKKYGRLGRSFGCPSVPMGLHKKIIETIKDRSCLFIYYPDRDYERLSAFFRDKVI